MSPNIFLTDFERSEHTDELHSVLGRLLIVATRFDSMCDAAARGLEFKKSAISTALMTETEFSDFLNHLTSKYRTLNENIKSLGLSKDVTQILHDAREARNAVAHDLAQGLEGCLDTRINDHQFNREVSNLAEDIIQGDIAISYVISLFNNDPRPNSEFISTYKDRVLSWIVER